MSRIRPCIQMWLLAFMLVLFFCHTALGAESPPGVYDFESGPGSAPGNWAGGPAATLSVDSTVVHSGSLSARIHRDANSDGAFSALSFRLPADREGDFIELRGWLKSEDVDEWFGLWLRLDGNAGMIALDNMQSRELGGTTEWTEYRTKIYLAPETRTFVCGALMAGSGTLWVDDLSLWIDDSPLAEAPIVEPELTVLDTDKEFSAGSGLDFTTVTPLQVENLALLGRVWGFLKYHHPAVVDGGIHWDFELFRVLPRVMAAADQGGMLAVLTAWIDALGPIPPCDPCAEETIDPAQPASIDWIRDTGLLGDRLSAQLQAVHAARPADGEQFWVGLMPNVGNPDFSREPGYANVPVEDTGYRLLSLYRFWNIIEYWCPNRDVIGEDWPQVMSEFVPLVVSASDVDSFYRLLLMLIARLNDTHTQLFGAYAMRPPGMQGQLPVVMRWVDNQVVVAGWADEFFGRATGLQKGDVILAVDGRPVPELMAEWAPYYSASNEPQRRMNLAKAVARGPVGSCRLQVLRTGEEFELTADRMAYGKIDQMVGRRHTLAGPAYRMLMPGVAYMALNGIKRDSVQTWIEDALAQDATGLVIDCRAYPGDFPIFQLGGHLVKEPTRFVAFTRADSANPGAFVWDDYIPLDPVAPHFPGKVVVLVDETSMSSAEYHALAFRAAPQAMVMGSTSSGADGNVSRFALPGGLTTMISGIGVFDDERQPTQRVGIVPDEVVLPTIEGIRDGRDEVLEAAVEVLLGRDVTEEEVGAWANSE
jgi:C-terminal processing protease CtpA/Prc